MHPKHQTAASLLLASLAACAAHAQHSTQFIRLGTNVAGPAINQALGVSADGRYVVGVGTGEAMLWSRDGGFVNVGNPHFTDFEQGSTATAVSNNGVVVGYVTDNDGNGNYLPWYWSAAAGFAGLDEGTLAAGRGVSADGTVIIGDRVNGELATVGYRWDATSGYTDVFPTQSIAFGLSSDGTVVGGIAGSSLAASQPFLWTAETGATLLGDIPGGVGAAGGNAVSANGHFAAGFGRTGAFTFQAGRFSADGNVGLGFLPGSSRSSAFAISGDGSVVGGDSIIGPPLGASEDRAFLWFDGAPANSPCTAMKDLKAMLQTRYRFDLTGLKLQIVNGISADGKTVIGTLQRTDFGSEGFVVIFGCKQDFNNDGAVDLFDYLDFLQDFAIASCNADYNFDGVVDLFDYLDFVSDFSRGAC